MTSFSQSTRTAGFRLKSFHVLSLTLTLFGTVLLTGCQNFLLTTPQPFSGTWSADVYFANDGSTATQTFILTNNTWEMDRVYTSVYSGTYKYRGDLTYTSTTLTLKQTHNNMNGQGWTSYPADPLDMTWNARGDQLDLTYASGGSTITYNRQ